MTLHQSSIANPFPDPEPMPARAAAMTTRREPVSSRAASRALTSLALWLTLSACSNPPPPLPEDYWPGPNGSWVETFRDEFEGPSGSAPDARYWNVEVRPTGFNRELDYNTNERRNSFLSGTGELVIQALRENYEYEPGKFHEQPFTSARLNSQAHVEPHYGRVEARIRLPAGKGLWPAFWMLGKNFPEVDWPTCGEVDIMEFRGEFTSVVHGSLHGPGYSGSGAVTEAYRLTSSNFVDDYHVFAFEWTDQGMRWLVDDEPYLSLTREGMARRGLSWVYDQPFFMILNLAVGGIYGGPPDETTPFPSQMLIDYVSVSRLEPQ